MSKQAMREEADRLVREALERKVAVKTAETRLECVCGKCGFKNKVTIPQGESRVQFACKECGHKQSSF